MKTWLYILALIYYIHIASCNITYNTGTEKKGIMSGKNQREAPECSLPKDKGDCRANIKKFYFDGAIGACREFNYTGCGGNLNNFITLDTCNSRCICSNPRDNGVGPQRMTMYFFNAETKKCQSFKYRGSGGNENKFLSIEQCHSVCERVAVRRSCQARPNVGTDCNNNSTTKFYYDKHCDCCRQFRYLGCGGNDNIFSSRQRCLRKCQLGESSKPAAPVQSQKPALCFLPNVFGNCNRYRTRYFYDTRLSRCVPFTYSGCGGNGNNFLSLLMCQRTCENDSKLSGLINTLQH
ncbi:carboxypeptidase inhibitor SmCI-like [Mercenaria mercenaria]|uniref:carboxypeptidase inhibitor SmCI-like n=1 Tax=Mercenaria mercenaria TaxID=6596 RepID=UPI00234ECE09|nr:carboxypeptidase inhibitor SmCI-like [Mercenaria mercenaria]